MKTTSLNTETDNLVLFPSAKNFAEEANLSDPMADLLNEYSHMSDADIPDYLDSRYEEDETEEGSESAPVYDSFEAYMARDLGEATLTSDDRLVKLINERMKAISEAKARIKFYLDEIEMFLPRRR